MTIATRRRVGPLLLTLVAAASVVLAPVGPSADAAAGSAAGSTARAEDPCLTEVVTGATLVDPGSRCDDTSPPETTLSGTDVSPNAHGYLAQDHLQVAFTGAYADADADPISFECQLYDTADAPTTWSSCSSPVDLTDLDDTTDTPYTFRVRAVDGNDRAIDATAGGGFLQPTPAPTDLPDLDETPPSISFYVDTTTPNTFVFDGPYDEVTPDYPMTNQRSLQVEITSNEPDAVFTCTLRGKTVPCTGGLAVFSKLRPGNQALRVTATDLAGNTDPTPTYTPFSVPTNLGPRYGRGWTRLKAGGGFFAHDLVYTTRTGAVLNVKATRAREMRLIAPTSAKFGRLEIRVGAQKRWEPLDQGTSTSAFAVIYQRFFGRKFTGLISIRAAKASTKAPAVVDAILLH